MLHPHLLLIIVPLQLLSLFFFFNDTATTEIYTLSLHDALPISSERLRAVPHEGSIVSVPGEAINHFLCAPWPPPGHQVCPCTVRAQRCKAASDHRPHQHRDKSTFPRTVRARDRNEKGWIPLTSDSKDRSTLPRGARYKAYPSDGLGASSLLSRRAFRRARWLRATRNCRPSVLVDSHWTSRSATLALPPAA